eukprot:11948540-Alexandrium_andersonii.AAC.1
MFHQAGQFPKLKGKGGRNHKYRGPSLAHREALPGSCSTEEKDHGRGSAAFARLREDIARPQG